MRHRHLLLPLLASAVAIAAPAVPAQATDLLVAPTRIVLDGQRGAEVILNNIGSETATYRISLELRRMTEEGGIDEVAEDDASATERHALDMIRYAPRRVTLPPNQPQAIRIGVRPPAGLADGEYRAHMLFRAIPKARPVSVTDVEVEGVNIALTPIYGVTIPVIIRQGRLSATAGISNARVELADGAPELVFDLSRTGDRSTYGEIAVLKPGMDDPLFVARGVAVYPEIGSRKVALRMPAEVAAKMTGPIAIEYRETTDVGSTLIARSDVVLR